MQTTLLGLAIAFIIALVAALVGPYFIDWNQFRPQFEAEATRVIGAQVRFAGKLDARLLPAPSLHLRSVAVGGANDLGKVRADKLDVEFSLGALMRGELRATELTINGMALDLGLDSQGRIDWPASAGKFNLGSLAIDRLNLTGRIALHDAASRGTLELNDIAFSGDVRSLAGSVRGDGNFVLSGTRYPFRVSSGQTADGNGTRVRLNIDPAARAMSADLEGVLSFEARAPRFDGSLTLAAPPGLKTGGDVPIVPWRVSARIKADPSTARLEQIEAAYGAEDSALRVTGAGDIRFGASPLLRATLSAKQLDADKFAAKGNGAAEPVRLLPGLRTLMAAIPQTTPIPAQIEFSAEQIMLGGRPLQNVAANLQAAASSLSAQVWTIERLEFRAPGATHVTLNGSNAQAGSFTGALGVDSSDPDALVTWLQGRGEVVYRSQKPLRLRGDLTVAPDRVAIEAMKAEIDGGAVEGRVEVATAGGSRIDAELKAERLDLDAAMALARSLAGPQAEWPDEAQLTLDIGRAISAGQELRPLMAKVGYGPESFALDQLTIGQAGSVMMEGAGSFDRVHTSGKLSLNASAASLGQITALIAPLAPALAARINAMGVRPGPAHLKLSLDLDKAAQQADLASARAVFDLDAPDLKGVVTIAAKPVITALQSIDLAALGRSEFSVESRLSSGQGGPLLAALGLDRAIAAGEGPAQFDGSVTGTWRAPLRLKVKMSGTSLDAEAEGTAEPWAAEPKANVNLKVRRVDLGPLLELKASDTLARNIGLSSRVSLTGNRLAFDDLDSAIAGSRLRGRLALVLGDEKNVEGEIGLDALDLGPAFALAIGAAGHDAAEPLGSGLAKGWRGRIAFQALRGTLPGGGELRPVSGVLKGDGQSLSFEAITGGIGGGEASASIDARQTGNGIALNARVQFTGVEGEALRYRGLRMPAGRASMQMTLASQGRSASALTGALSGSGTVTLETAAIAGLDPRAFDAAIRASDSGQAGDDVKLRQIVERALSGGALSVKSAQIPFSIGDGRIRIGATKLDAEGARAIVSGGYDIPADQADIRASLASTAAGSASSSPEIQLFAAGPPDALDRSIDVAALSSWLAVRAIDRETRRLDAIERGEPPPFSASLPPAATAPSGAPEAVLPGLPASEVPIPGRDPRRAAPKAKAAIPAAPIPPAPGAATPAVRAPVAPIPGAASSGAASPNAPVVSQQAAPLPPPIEIKPAPGSTIARPPRLRPPLVLTPQP
ncbi:MAG: AsmA-like C-terminal region-containing protein [Bradyrhizobium sp.]|uniref:AsmA family protein n=1 Tax=Bradyrhizobium sp. TaxID=376 RepID=UPI00271F1758|nr:AsmA-like C-terminal region-containing protein [Bradyrhizobium sp.]MDO9564733.1 AsmA-like C-terminal region-containing protein [Bradyrhizobium sp.]MDP3689745.1 AsmA-like C-terminal region-containing protein [Bradyrhizobium sp.]